AVRPWGTGPRHRHAAGFRGLVGECRAWPKHSPRRCRGLSVLKNGNYELKLLVIDRKRAGAGGGEIKKQETEQDGRVAAILGGEEAAILEVHRKIGDRHFARSDEGGAAAEQAQ